MSRGHRIYTLAPTGITRHNVRHRLQGDPPSPQGEVLRGTQPALGDSLRAQIIPSCVSGGEGNAEAHDWAPSLTHTKPRVRGLTTTRRPSSRRAAGPPLSPSVSLSSTRAHTSTASTTNSHHRHSTAIQHKPTTKLHMLSVTPKT